MAPKTRSRTHGPVRHEHITRSKTANAEQHEEPPAGAQNPKPSKHSHSAASGPNNTCLNPFIVCRCHRCFSLHPSQWAPCSARELHLLVVDAGSEGAARQQSKGAHTKAETERIAVTRKRQRQEGGRFAAGPSAPSSPAGRPAVAAAAAATPVSGRHGPALPQRSPVGVQATPQAARQTPTLARAAAPLSQPMQNEGVQGIV